MNIYFLLLKHPSGQSLFRAVATILAVILATLTILVTVSLGQGWMTRDQKANLVTNLFPATTSISADSTSSPIYLSTYDTDFNSLPVKELGIRKTTETDILPGGLTNTPNDNEIWVTPGLKRLIDANPSLAERYAKYHIEAIFPSEIAPSPDSLMLLYRIQDKTLRTENSQLQVSSAAELWSRYNRQNAQDKESAALRVMLPLMAGVIIITPVLLLIAEIARIGIVQREKRYAALSLAGVTRMQVRLLIAAETLPLSLLGTILGIIIFISVGLPVLAHTPVGDNTIWLSDLDLSTAVCSVVCIAIIICSLVAGLQSIGVLKISPLAVTRTSTDIKKPSLFSTLPLLLGIVGLWTLSTFGRSWYKDNPELGTYLLLGLVLIIILGIFFAGSFLTRTLSSILLRTAHGASTTMAAHRLRSVSRKEFHSISGIVLALFVGTLLMTILATVQVTGSKYQDAQAVAAEDLNPLQDSLQVSISLSGSNSDELLRGLKDNAELSNLAANSYVQKSFRENGGTDDESENSRVGNYYDSCAVYKQRTKLACDSSIPTDSPLVAMLQIMQTPDGKFNKFVPQLTPINPAAGTISNSSYVLVAKGRGSLERIANKVYSIASDYHLSSGTQISVDYIKANDNSATATIKGLENLIIMILIITMTTGGLSLLVNVTGSVFERKRTFIRLRAIGANIGALAKSLSIEVLAPLCALSALVVSLGIFTCYCMLSAIGAFNDGHMDFSLPSAALWIGLGTTIIVCVVISLLNIPLLAKITNFDEMRSE